MFCATTRASVRRRALTRCWGGTTQTLASKYPRELTLVSCSCVRDLLGLGLWLVRALTDPANRETSRMMTTLFMVDGSCVLVLPRKKVEVGGWIRVRKARWRWPPARLACAHTTLLPVLQGTVLVPAVWPAETKQGRKGHQGTSTFNKEAY